MCAVLDCIVDPWGGRQPTARVLTWMQYLLAHCLYVVNDGPHHLRRCNVTMTTLAAHHSEAPQVTAESHAAASTAWGHSSEGQTHDELRGEQVRIHLRRHIIQRLVGLRTRLNSEHDHRRASER